jgi:ABC-type xylose transport system substrate-binding protein
MRETQERIMSHWRKEEIVKTTSSIPTGSRDVPAILMNLVVVTKDNGRKTVIEDGFQNLETIQKNLSNAKWPK